MSSLSFLHSPKHPKRFTELHGEEKREEGDRGDQEEKRGIKRGESNLAGNPFPICSPLHVSFELWFSQGICPVVGLLGHMVDLFLVFF